MNASNQQPSEKQKARICNGLCNRIRHILDWMWRHLSLHLHSNLIVFDRKPKRAAEHQASDMSECIDQCNVKKKGQEAENTDLVSHCCMTLKQCHRVSPEDSAFASIHLLSEQTTSALQLTGKVNAVHVKSVSTVRGLLLCEFISVRKTLVFRSDHTGY